MRISLFTVAFSLVLGSGLAACDLGGGGEQGGAGGSGASTADGAGNQGASDPGGGDVGGGGDGGAPAQKGWRALPLIDDESDPDNVIFHAGNDRVMGITYRSASDGFVLTAGANASFQNGGAIFHANAQGADKVLFSGDGTGVTLLGSIDFRGLEPMPNGYVALAYASDVIYSDDNGQTFKIEKDGVGDPFGIEAQLAFRKRSDGYIMVRDTGVVSYTSDEPGPNAIWDDIWAPTGLPSTPDPVPADQCQVGPSSGHLPKQRDPVYIASDGQFIAYTASDDQPMICVSHDGGHSFYPSILEGVSEDVAFAAPNGVYFTSATNGITYYANYLYPEASYIYRTTDGGETWSPVALPADVANKGIELNGAFFAPDGQTGFIVGYNYDNGIALMLRTKDGGATWDSESGDLAAKVDEAGGGKLYTGFALDANHIWVGGDYGVLMANDAGGA